MTPTTVDAVIVSYNSAAYLRDCIVAAREWSALGRVIVVDNASADDSVNIAREYADDVVAGRENLGYGAGQNLGIERSTAAYVLALNPDARVVPQALDRGLDLLQGRCDVAAVQGAIVRAGDGEFERTAGREPGLADLAAHRFRLRERVGERALRLAAALLGLRYFSDRVPAAATSTPFLAAVAPLIRRAAFDHVAGFDTQYFLYAEDVDLSHRLCSRGWKLMTLPDVWAIHEGGASTADAPQRRNDEWWRGHRRLVEQHWTGARRLAGLALTHGFREAANG